MADRALIIAIEEYPNATDGGTEKKLEGTLAAALEFKTWLENKWQDEGVSGEILFCSHPLLAGQLGADRRDIVRALMKLQEKGRNQTDNLYVYFSGHGFRLPNMKSRADVLVTADFESLALSADCCFKLDALVDGLRSSMGAGNHYYFIDACRNEIAEAIGTNIMPFGGLGTSEAALFMLQSTVPGAPSLVGGPFAEGLIQGLQGRGIAKIWVPPVSDSMVVRFDTLGKYLREKLTQNPVYPINEGKGADEAVLRIIKPVLKCTLTVTFSTTLPPWEGCLIVTSFNGTGSQAHDIKPAGLTLELNPNDYSLEVQIHDTSITPSAKMHVHLYEDQEVTFHVDAPAPVVRLLNLESVAGNPEAPDGDGADDAMRFGTDETAAKVARPSWQGSAPHQSIASHFRVDGDAVDFSKSLNEPVTDPDLNLWLAILGAGRILGKREEASLALTPLDLHDFSRDKRKPSAIYLLAGFSDITTQLAVGLHQQDQPDRIAWKKTRSPRGLEGVREVVLHPPPGQVFVTLQVGTLPTCTIATYSEENRCTLLVLTLDDEGQPSLAQFLLPLGNRISQLPVQVRGQLSSRGRLLPDVVMMARFTRAFRQRRSLKAEFKTDELDYMLYGKWVDPIGTSLAFYEYLRRDRHSQELVHAIGNMSTFFRELPDTPAILHLASQQPAAPSRPPLVPLFLDGLRAYPYDRAWLPFPAELLDFTGPWTAWRGAVKQHRFRDRTERPKPASEEPTPTPPPELDLPART